jgi:capsular exopolysaccharide synthesis family protein
VILFTSGTTGEGKTVTTVNEAITLAQAGGSVLIIDADIRKPRLHRIFDVPNGHGLSSYLTGQSPLDASIHEVPISPMTDSGSGSGPLGRLSVLPSGPIPPNPAELLGSRQFRDMLQILRDRYDYILLDTPPILPVTDAVILATVVDGVVLVARGGRTPYEIVMKSRDRLAYVRAKIIGIVLNDVNVRSGDYGYYNRYYYSYYAKASSALS